MQKKIDFSSNKKNPNQENKETKIVLETSADLYKLPLSMIKNTKIYNYEGKYYDSLYEEALKIERSGGLENFSVQSYLNKEIKIEKIEFEMKYQTQMGQELGVLGSMPELGSWNQDKAKRMQWNEWNIWRIIIEYNEEKDFEYKYIFVVNNKVEKWEDGENRKFEYKNIKEKLNSNNKGGDVIKIENINKQNFEYDNKTKVLKIISNWNEK